MRTKLASMNPLGLKKQNRWLGGESARVLDFQVFAEGSEDCSIGSSGEEQGSGGILAPISFNPEHDDSTGNEGATQNQNPATPSNSGVRVKRHGRSVFGATTCAHW